MGEIDVSDVAPTTYVQANVDATGPAVREALPDHLRPEFEKEFKAALVEAAETFDLEPVQKVIDGWRCHAIIYTTPELFEELKETQARIKVGKERFSYRDSSDNWHEVPDHELQDEDG